MGVIASVVILLGMVRWLRARRHTSVSVDVGPVSEGWLAEQRGRKDS
jgi:hypothetical protein